VGFGELNDKMIKSLTYLSETVRRFHLYIHELLLEYLLGMDITWLTLEKTNI
jgi:hypothetical protein